MELRTMLRELARLRKLLDEISAARKGLEEVLANLPESKRIAELRESARVVAGQKESLEHEIREAAKALWQPGQPKEVIGGVKVRERKCLVYSTIATLEWCEKNAKTYLQTSLDVAAFERAVLAGALPGAPAEVENIVEVVLDRDLSAYLEEPRQVEVKDEGKGHEQQAG